MYITDSRSDEWIYWCSFIVTRNFDSLQSLTVYDSLHYLLDHERLPFYYDERRIPAHILNCLEQCLSLESTLTHFWLLASSIVCFGLYLCTACVSPESESESYVTTDGQSASLSWNKAPIWGLRPDLYYCMTVAGLLIWGALFMCVCMYVCTKIVH
jgi:hypothetical protein